MNDFYYISKTKKLGIGLETLGLVFYSHHIETRVTSWQDDCLKDVMCRNIENSETFLRFTKAAKQTS